LLNKKKILDFMLVLSGELVICEGASYMFGRALSSVIWGIVADKYGRKPIIIITLISIIIFNTLFGLSSSYWMALTSRGLLGLMCGILGPIKVPVST
jgi:MFS family permease